MVYLPNDPWLQDPARLLKILADFLKGGVIVSQRNSVVKVVPSN